MWGIHSLQNKLEVISPLNFSPHRASRLLQRTTDKNTANIKLKVTLLMVYDSMSELQQLVSSSIKGKFPASLRIKRVNYSLICSFSLSSFSVLACRVCEGCVNSLFAHAVPTVAAAAAGVRRAQVAAHLLWMYWLFFHTANRKCPGCLQD